jgi:thymidylate synthase
MLSFDMNDGFPAITTKKLAFNQVKGELIGFLRGYTNAADFRALGCTIWDQNSNENEAWLKNPARKGTDDLGCIYGAIWRKWPDTKMAHNSNEAQALAAQRYELLAHEYDIDEEESTYVMCGHIDQLANAVNDVINNPTSRRIKVEAWNVSEIGNMALPPCHTGFQLYVNTRDRELSMTMNQRSCDMFLGIPFNIASYALLLTIIADATGLKPRHLKMFLTDCHIYENHVEQVKEQLLRTEFPLPQIGIIAKEEDETPMQFIERLKPEDIFLMGYESHATIKAPMAV